MGELPIDLRNAVVEYRPVISWISNAKGIRGQLLDRALHSQYHRIYCYNHITDFHVVDPASGELATSRQFLEWSTETRNPWRRPPEDDFMRI
jgi:hypothetical protein